MLGYMTAKKAKSMGFTHHGSYYGIPIWVTNNPHNLQVSVKWMPLDIVFDIASVIEGMINHMMMNEPSFRLVIGKEIK